MNLEKGSNDYRDATWYFFNPITDDRLPLYVNKMICCSERENLSIVMVVLILKIFMLLVLHYRHCMLSNSQMVL